MCISVDASQHRLNHKSLISPNFIMRQTLSAKTKSEPKETLSRIEHAEFHKGGIRSAIAASLDQMKVHRRSLCEAYSSRASV
jgi:hypothetical protein